MSDTTEHAGTNGSGNGMTKPKRKVSKMSDMVETMAILARQNQQLIDALRARNDAPAPPPAPTPITPEAPKEPEKLTKFQLRSMHRRDKRELKKAKQIGGLVPATIVDRFHAICIEKQIPVYDGLERALSAWIELES